MPTILPDTSPPPVSVTVPWLLLIALRLEPRIPKVAEGELTRRSAHLDID
jgi:hypothetical protein